VGQTPVARERPRSAPRATLLRLGGSLTLGLSARNGAGILEPQVSDPVRVRRQSATSVEDKCPLVPQISLALASTPRLGWPCRHAGVPIARSQSEGRSYPREAEVR